MCGIAGCLDLRTNPKNSPQLLKRMSDVIIHRGPDSDGQWLSDDLKMGMSFRRLSIIDLSENGSQPMRSTDSRYTITFNGEIYNHLDIKKELKDFDYRGNSDTESILNGYAKFGKNVFQKMIGMWGIAIWDQHEEKLLLCRDRIGIKPLYYYFNDGLLIYGSEIKSILEHPDVTKELNLDEIPNYLNFGMSSGKESLFKNIKKLPPAHFLEINKHGEIQINKYWTPYDGEDNSHLTQKEIQEQTIEKLRGSIKSRMMSDVPFGVFLSGGIDSSLNVALMSELMDRPVDTYTVGFEELEQFNELKYARQISNQFHTNHNEILIDENDAFPILNDLAWHTDEPNADPVCIPLYFLSKLTRDSGTTVVQVGEGSDEQYVGYKWMLQGYKFYNSYWKLFKSLPKFLQKAIYGLSSPLFKGQNQFLALDYLRRAVHDEEFNWSGVSIYSPSHLKELFSDKISDKWHIPAEHGSSLHQDAFNEKSSASYLQRILHIELKQRLAEILLMRVDKIGMAHSIEARVPFLDHRIVEFNMSLGDKQKVPDYKLSKFILKKAVEGILPNDISYRKKMGFAAPVDNWFRGPWKKFAEDQLLHSEFSKLGLFNQDFLKKYLDLHSSGKKNLGADIYSLVALSLWYERYFS